jgi:alpha-beta hydrolase superfamily lysophospholipase
VVDLTAPDGTMLEATYLAASKRGPGVMLFHQCNRDRKMWEELAPRLVAAGLNVLTLEFRGYGDSGRTAKFKVPLEDGRWLVSEVWPRRGELLTAAVEPQAVPGSFNSRVAQARRGPHSAQDDNSVPCPS